MFSTYRKLFELLDRRERRQFFALLTLVILMGIIDMVGVASIMPFLAVVADPGIAHRNQYLALLYSASGATNDQGFLILLACLVLAFIGFSLVIKLLTLYMIARFSHMRSYSISSRLFARYLHQPYVWFLNHHSASMGTAVLSEVDRVVGGAMIPAMRILAQSVSILLIVGLLIVLNPLIAISVTVIMGGAYGLIFLFVRKRLARLGRIRSEAAQARQKQAYEAVGGIKELKLLSLEDQYVERFKVPARTLQKPIPPARALVNSPDMSSRQWLSVAWYCLFFSCCLAMIARERLLVSCQP